MVVELCLAVVPMFISLIIWDTIKLIYCKLSGKEGKPKYIIYHVFPRGFPKFWRVIDDDSVKQLHEIFKQYDDYEDILRKLKQE